MWNERRSEATQPAIARSHRPPALFVCLVVVPLAACQQLVRTTDRDVARLIAQRQREALAYQHPVPLGDADQPAPQPERAAYDASPRPTTTEIPEDFRGVAEPAPPAESAPPAGATYFEAGPPVPAAKREEAAARTRLRDRVFTLTDALAYAQQHRREYQSAKEDLYLAALALTLERHLWTPQFAANVRGVYGNYGAVRDFDQATRFVADLSVTQRLPYGGEFTAAAVSTLIRDVKRSITASEGSSVALGLNIPFLRGAGHVAQEDLIQLERSLTYAVRSFERFRRAQLVAVATRYFSLLSAKQRVIDRQESVRRAEEDLERTLGRYRAGQVKLLDVGREEIRLLGERNALTAEREAFRSATDQFKIFIGMPLDEPIGLDDLESIEEIERQVSAGKYPLLWLPPAATAEERAIQVAVERRLDLLNQRDAVEDARRGVALARNALLPDLGWTSSLTFDTDPEHYRLGGFEVARATWRTEVLLSLNDRFRERNAYRSSIIDARRAQRSYEEQVERVRAEVRSAANQIRLQTETVAIQQRNVQVADEQRQFAGRQYELGRLDNRDRVEFESQYTRALNALSEAKTARWSRLLEFRLATETLEIDEDGVQRADPAFQTPDAADPQSADAAGQPASGATPPADS